VIAKERIQITSEQSSIEDQADEIIEEVPPKA
jgi:hypothetical protein